LKGRREGGRTRRLGSEQDILLGGCAGGGGCRANREDQRELF